MVIDLKKICFFVKLISLEHKILNVQKFYSSLSDDNAQITGASQLKLQTESINISIHFNVVHPTVYEYQ